MVGVHLWAARNPGTAGPGFWGTLPSVWDHPEPNYMVSGAIVEFWSVLTTIPVAGSLLLYEGIKYGYAPKVLGVYVITCAMYTLAFAAHMTLESFIFSSTVTAVMSNALYTFSQFSTVVHPHLQQASLRGTIVLASFVALVSAVATLPYAIAKNGGVWTLFIVQTPGVLLATAIAAYLARHAAAPEEREAFNLVWKSGSLLSTAMLCSLFECMYGFDYGYIPALLGFPWLHIIIHVLEQVGIYLYGVGVATLQLKVLSEQHGPELHHAGGWLVYLYCPRMKEQCPQIQEQNDHVTVQ